MQLLVRCHWEFLLLAWQGADPIEAMASWKGIENDIEHFWVPNAKGKKIYLTEVRSYGSACHCRTV